MTREFVLRRVGPVVIHRLKSTLLGSRGACRSLAPLYRRAACDSVLITPWPNCKAERKDIVKMRSFPTLGFLSLVSALALVGCGDDEGDGNGNGGSSGSGMAGNAGDGGTGGNGGNGGNGGSSMAGNGGGGGATACTDCAELVMPFTAAAQNVPYRFNHAAPGLDYSTAVITWNIIVETPNANISVQPQLQNANPPSD